MALKFNQAGKERMLSLLLNKTTSTSAVSMKLFTSNTTPIWASSQTPASFTEDSAAGYAPITMTGANWTLSTAATEKDVASYAKVTFTYTAASTVYGYMLTNAAGELIGAEKFSDGPYTLGSSGGNINVTLSLSVE